MMRATGTLYLARTAPLATHAQDGTFALTLLAMDRIGAHQVEPWRITYTGLGALLFWSTYQADLIAGQPIEVELDHVRTFSNGARGGAPETHARVQRIALVPRAADINTEERHGCRH